MNQLQLTWVCIAVGVATIWGWVALGWLLFVYGIIGLLFESHSLMKAKEEAKS